MSMTPCTKQMKPNSCINWRWKLQATIDLPAKHAVDAMYFLYSQIQAPKTFGELAKSILTKLLALVERIDFVCDTYTSPSINDVESSICGSQNDRFLLKITDAEQICPKDFQEAMKSCNVKSSLLAHEWPNQAYFDIIKGHILYFGIEDKAYRYDVHVNSGA